MEPERVYYCCEMCKGEMYAEVREVGFYPSNVPCDKCEGAAIINYNPVEGMPAEYKLIRPDLEEWIKYRNIEEARWIKLGFSKIECSYLFEHDIKFIERGGLILIRK